MMDSTPYECESHYQQEVSRILPIRLAWTSWMKKDCVSGSATLDASRIRRTAIMSSAAFPNVAFSKPPRDSVVLNAISSVALPMRNARGIIAIREEKNAMEWFDSRS